MCRLFFYFKSGRLQPGLGCWLGVVVFIVNLAFLLGKEAYMHGAGSHSFPIYGVTEILVCSHWL